jgi:hypothetical protein
MRLPNWRALHFPFTIMLRLKARKQVRSVFQWHRYVGLTAFLFVIMLAVTGVMLNHTEGLLLDQIYVKSDLLLDWYGITPPHVNTAFLTANHSILQLEDRLYMDHHLLKGPALRLRGAVETGNLVIVAATSTVLLLTSQGELVEQLGTAEGVPAGLRAIGRTRDGHVVIVAADGHYTADKDFLSWRRYHDRLPVLWSRPRLPPRALAHDLQQHYRSHILPVERVMLDLHSGRILGYWGVFVVDAAALLLCFLGFSGCWLWYERYRKRKAREKHWPRSRN